MMRFILAPEAERDLDEIWEYIAQDDLDAADRFIEKLLDNVRKLADRPGMGHTREDLVEDRALRFWPVGNYLISYRAVALPIEIVAVVQGSHDIPSFIARRSL